MPSNDFLSPDIKIRMLNRAIRASCWTFDELAKFCLRRFVLVVCSALSVVVDSHKCPISFISGHKVIKVMKVS